MQMIINIADSINTLLQCIMIIYIINYCTGYKYKKSKLEVYGYIFLLYIIGQVLTKILGNSSLGIIISHGALLLYGAIIFRKDSLGATIGFSIIYLFININLIICSNILYGYIVKNINIEYINQAIVLCIYLPQYIMSFFILVKKKAIYKIYRIIRSKNFSIISLILVTVIIDFINSFNLIIHDLDNPVFKEIIFILLGIFMVVLTVYFANIEKKSKEIIILNNALEEKVEELKKVKHDYGAQISYLYGIHLMGKYDRLGDLLKDIINGHNNIESEVMITPNASTISMIIRGIEHRGVNIIVDEQVDLEKVELSEIELQRVISNILRNSVTAMKNRGVITIRTYYEFNKFVIKIQNNGPKIEENIINKIFEPGFSTQKDAGEKHGFGLAIVKEIVEKYDGNISVSSSEKFTEFLMKFPYNTGLVS